jgi:hypothetical protein
MIGLRGVTSSVRFSKSYFTLALGVLAVEVVIALALHDEFIRPFVGDALAVILLYCAVQTVWGLRPVPAALGVCAFGCALEIGQYYRLVWLLGLEHHTWARVIIGTTYDSRDFFAYVTGAVVIVIAEFLRHPHASGFSTG